MFVSITCCCIKIMIVTATRRSIATQQFRCWTGWWFDKQICHWMICRRTKFTPHGFCIFSSIHCGYWFELRFFTGFKWISFLCLIFESTLQFVAFCIGREIFLHCWKKIYTEIQFNAFFSICLWNCSRFYQNYRKRNSTLSLRIFGNWSCLPEDGNNGK